MKKSIARCLLFFLLFQFIPFTNIQNSFAVDGDGTANLDLLIIPSIPESSIIGSNFNFNFTLKNQNTSEDDAYKNGFILSLEDGVEFVSSAKLWTPERIVSYTSGSFSGTTLYFFETDTFLTRGGTDSYSVALKSATSADLLSNHDVKILAYANDNIYGRWAVPIWAPVATLPGWVDLAEWIGFPNPIDPTDLNFPDNITTATDLSSLPFIQTQTKFIPFDIEKAGSDLGLIWHEHTTTLTIKWNDLGELKNFSIQDVIPNNRKFVAFTSTGWVSNIDVSYNTPSAGQTTLSLSGITVPTGTDLDITYTTLSLAYPIVSYNGSWAITLDTTSPVVDRTSSVNMVTHIMDGTWNNGTSDIPVDGTTLVSTKSHNEVLAYAKIWKTVNLPQPVIWDIVRYTIDLELAKNVAFSTSWAGTYISDLLPDGLSFSGTVSSTNLWTGNTLNFSGATTDANWDTTILWTLNSGEVKADDVVRIVYEALVDWVFEWAWTNSYTNTDSLVNTATFLWTISDSTNSAEWWDTHSSILSTSITHSDSASITAPEPVNEKRLISVELPNSTVYDFSNPLPANTAIPVGSKLKFAVSMNFPNVGFSWAIIKDALPLLVGPNDSIYDITFQTNNTLRDINNNLVSINDDNNDGTADSSFNGLVLSWSVLPNNPWIVESPANNVEFHLGNAVGARTFSIVFTADVLPVKPSWYNNEWFLPEKNVSIATFNDGEGVSNSLDIFDVPFDIALPALEMTKTMSGANIEAGSDIDYSIEIKNTWKATAYLENITDTLPDSLTLQSYSMTASWFVLGTNSLTQSGSEISMSFNTGATLGRSTLPENSSIIIDYRVKAGTGMIINSSLKTNTIKFDYYAAEDAAATGVNNFGPLTADASFTTKQPSISRTLLSTSETWSTGASVEIGEEATFETVITLPAGTYNSSSFQDTSNSNLSFLSGSVVSFSGALSFSTWTGFLSNTATFWTLINSDTDTATPETIVIHSTYRVKTSASNGSKYTRGRFYYGWGNVYRNSNITVRQPNIILNKSVSPLSWDAGDTLTYTIALNNSWNAKAYDLVLTDILNSHFTFVTGSLVSNSFSSSETNFLSSTGITLWELAIWWNESVSFQVTVNDDIAPADSLPNTANLTYDSLNADDSAHEKDYSTNSNVGFTVTNVSLVHNLISTNNSDTGTGRFNTSLYDLHIWEQANYITTLTIPESTFTGMTVSQSLPVWYKFLTGSIWTSSLSHSLSGIVIGPDNTITYTLWDIVNLGSDGVKTIDLFSQIVVLDTAGPTSGQEKWLSTLLASWQWAHSTSVTTNLDIVEPNLTILKDYSISTWDSGDSAVTTVTITNNGTAPAYDLAWTDTQSTDVTTTGNFFTSSGATILNPGSSISYSYTTTLNNTVSSWDFLTGTASVVYTSAPGINAEERTYPAVSDSDTIQVVVNGGLVATLDTQEDVKIWDTSSYTIRVPIAEWTTSSLQIEDLLPSGVAVNTGSIVLTTSGAITYLWATQPVFTATGMVWNFTNIVNSNIDNAALEEFIINFDTVTLNTLDTNSGDTKVHNVKAIYNGWEQKTAATSQIKIVEADIALSISNIYTQTNGLVKYTFSLLNTGTSHGHELNLATLLPAGVTYTWSLNLTNTGWSVNLVQAGNNFTIESLGVNTGNPMTFEIFATVDGSQSIWDVLTLTWNLLFSSQTGSYTPVIPLNSDNTERTGIGGVNDYSHSANTSFTYQDAILEESISVVDDNGGNHLAQETYTYTVTLTNTWNVALTSIPVTVDIPEYLSGSTFSLQSIPGGSSQVYSSTGWAYSNGLLNVTWINIPVGESRTIVYKINSLYKIPDGTNITTVANVWNTPEWAIGWNPSVDLVIIAPNLETTSIEVDDNWAQLFKNQTITHTNSVKNIGSATGSNVQVELLYTTWTVSYVSGSLSFISGSLVDTGSIVIDEINGKINFNLTSIAPNTLETFTFKTLTIGQPWNIVVTNITAEIDEWFISNTTSNQLRIVSQGWGGSGTSRKKDSCPDWDYSGSRYDKKCGEKPGDKTPELEAAPEKPKEKLPENENPEKEKKKEEKEVIKKPEISILKKYLEERKKKKDLLENLLKQQNDSGTSLLKWLPKVLPRTGTQISTRVQTRLDDRVETSLPDTTNFRLAGSKNTDIDFWKQVLVQQDRDAQKYIVIPSNGMVVPINEVKEKTSDFDEMINGREIDVNKYLQNGGVEYPGTSKNWYGELGNKVIFAHSSYWKEDAGRYKTHFQKIIELDVNEEVWVYEKTSSGEYKRFVYIVSSSYNTDESDVDVLKPGIWKNLTLFTCTPIWGTAGRWIIQAKYVDEVISELEKDLSFSDISARNHLLINDFIAKIWNIEDVYQREQLLFKVYYRLEELLWETSSDSKMWRILELIKTKIVQEIVEL